MAKNISINHTKVRLGKSTVIDLSIARLPSRTQIDLPIYVYRSKEEGPTLLLSGGLHGDEVNGIEIVRRMIANRDFDNLQCGSVIAIPIMNIFGFLNFSREVPDGKDINRNFPGNKRGSLASRMAYEITHKILEQIDCGIDFHTGGASRYNYPQCRYAPNDPKAKELAEAFSAPITLASKLIEKSLRKEAYKMGKSIVVFEGGETLRFDEYVINEGIKGAHRVMQKLGMIPKKDQHSFSLMSSSSTWVRAKSSGLFTALSHSGKEVNRNQVIGKITDPFGQFETKVKASQAGILIGHNNMPVVNQGDALFHIGLLNS